MTVTYHRLEAPSKDALLAALPSDLVFEVDTIGSSLTMTIVLVGTDLGGQFLADVALNNIEMPSGLAAYVRDEPANPKHKFAGT